MRPIMALFFAGIAIASPARAMAQALSFDGFLDLRAVVPAGERSWLDGGLGKLRYGGAQPDPDFRFAQATGQATLALQDDLRIVAVARVEPKDRAGIDALEAYAVYHPHTNDWDGALKAGAFFPPFSLENTDLGWTSPYTLTPSAINAWIGDELRTIGGEAQLVRRTAWGSFALTGAIFCCNDPAGVLMADRGWTLDDRPTGLFEEVRVPDATLRLFGATPPDRTALFREIDNRAGWYGGASWSMPGIGKAALYHYDNNADPAASSGDYHGWRTRFWSAGWESHWGALSLLAQGMTGDTAITPFPGNTAQTDFKSAYLLAG